MVVYVDKNVLKNGMGVGIPGTPAELANWLRGGFMSGDL